MRPFEESPNIWIRAGGLAYLLVIGLGLFGEAYARGSLIAGDDGQATLANIGQHQALWRAGIAGDLLMYLLDVPLLVLFYLMLRPVSRSLALLATVFHIVQTAVLATNKLTLLTPLLIITTSAPLTGLSSDALGNLTALAVSMHGYGLGVGLLFFGCCCVLRGYLILRSGFLPATLGVMLAVAGVSYLVDTAALLLAPQLASELFPWVLLPAFVGELAMSLWLIFRGVDMQAWGRRQRPPGALPPVNSNPTPSAKY